MSSLNMVVVEEVGQSSGTDPEIAIAFYQSHATSGTVASS